MDHAIGGCRCPTWEHRWLKGLYFHMALMELRFFCFFGLQNFVDHEKLKPWPYLDDPCAIAINGACVCVYAWWVASRLDIVLISEMDPNRRWRDRLYGNPSTLMGWDSDRPAVIGSSWMGCWCNCCLFLSCFFTDSTHWTTIWVKIFIFFQPP